MIIDELHPDPGLGSPSRLARPWRFLNDWLQDLGRGLPIARRFFGISLNQRYRSSSLGLAWAFVPAVVTALALIVGQRSRTLGLGAVPGAVPMPFYGVFGLLMAQSFLESFQAFRVIFSRHRQLLLGRGLPIEGLLLAGLGEVGFAMVARQPVLICLFVFYGIEPRWATLPLAGCGLLASVLLGAGLGLLLAPLAALRSDLDHVGQILPWVLFALTPVVVAPAAGSLLEQICRFNPLTWIFDGTRAAAYGGPGQAWVPALGLLAGLLVVAIGALFCRVCRPHVLERLL